MLHFVESQAPCQLRVVGQDQHHVLDGLGKAALLGDLQFAVPVSGVLGSREVLRGLSYAVGDQLGPDFRVLGGQLCHGLVARPGTGRRVRVGVGVQVVELVQPDQIPGVDQLGACRIRGVVAIAEFVVIDHHAGRCAALGVGVAPRLVAGLVHRHEGLDSLLDGVGPAEGSDDAALLGRVFLLGRCALDSLRDSAAHRPA